MIKRMGPPIRKMNKRMIPNDDELSKANYLGKPLTGLSSDSAAVMAVEEIAEKLGLLSEAAMLRLLGKEP